jgi:hypothetical protein
MNEAALRTDDPLESQPKMGVRNLAAFDMGSRLSEIIRVQPASINDALECAYGKGLIAVHGHDNLPTVGMTPFLVAALLADHAKAVAAQDEDNVLGGANWKALSHGSATSSTFAPVENETGDGSNQSSRASFALATASSSVSPAEAHPGSSGKKAAHLWASGSCSRTSRNFIAGR